MNPCVELKCEFVMKNNHLDMTNFQLAKTQEELTSKINEQNTEILNSVEDMKQLASSVPNGLHDLLPKIEKIGAEVWRSHVLQQ